VSLDLIERLPAKSGRGQLDRQWDPIDPPANLCDELVSRFGCLEQRIDSARSQQKELFRFGADRRAFGLAGTIAWNGEGRKRFEILSRDIQSHSARGQYSELWAALQELGNQGGRLYNMLHVIKHEQLRFLADDPAELVDRDRAGLQVASNGLCDLGGHQRRLTQGSEPDNTRPACQLAIQAPGNLEGDTRFADSGGAGDRDQPCVRSH
jgi:hypothetical protein